MYEKDDWNHHIIPVVKCAKKLAKIYKVNEEIVELAALLHDIGRTDLKKGKDHHITGIPKAEEILKKYNFSEKVIEEVKHCIESHRGSKSIKPKTKIAEIISNADGMAHLDNFFILIYLGTKIKMRYKEIIEWINKKIERDWNTKLTLPEAKKMMKEKYKAIKLLLYSAKKYI